MSQQQLRAIVTLVIVGLACAPRPAHAAAVFKVGTFNKSACTAPCNQPNQAHGLGVQPQVLILWTDGATVENFAGANWWWAFGVTDGTTSRSSSASSKHSSSSSSASRRSAAAVLTIVEYANVLRAEAIFQSPTKWDATNFYLQWTTNNTSQYFIHFIAIAGLTNAQVLDWAAPTTGTGTQTATLASPQFQPDVVLHFMGYSTVLATAADAAFMLGAMDAAGDSWATSFYSQSGQGTSVTARAQVGSSNASPACIEETNQAATETLRGGTCTVTSTGWTVNFTTNSVGAQHIFSLALKGLNVHVGSFNRSGNAGCAAPCNQTVPGVGFLPTLALFSSYMTTAQSTPATALTARFGLGATDDTTEAATVLDDKNAATNTYVANEETTDAFDVVDNDTSSYNAKGHIKSGSSTGSFNSDGFIIDWTTNADNVATEILYIAMGPMDVSAVKLTSFTATRMLDGGTLVAWRTGYEVDNVGFRVYREQNGQRVRITSSLVPGTALIGVGRGASTGGRTYTWSDAAAPPGAGPVQYWLEDVDLKGKSTWHGPILPVITAPREPVR